MRGLMLAGPDVRARTTLNAWYLWLEKCGDLFTRAYMSGMLLPLELPAGSGSQVQDLAPDHSAGKCTRAYACVCVVRSLRD